MANEIKLKRGSGSNPSASDLSVGEVALRTDNASLFTKKDDGSVAEIGAAAGVSDGDKGDITVSNSGATFTIDNDAVTLAKMQNVITDTILGRTTNGTGNIEVLSAASVRGIINVEDGATADQSASEILTLLKTVDGAGSGLDADTLDGISSASFLRSDANTLLNGILTIGGSSVSGGEGGEFRMTYAPNGSLSGSNLTVDVNNNNFRIFEDGGNNRGVFLDLTTCSNSASGKLYHDGNDGSGSGLDADLLDGQHGSYYRNAGNINAGTISDARLPSSISSNITGNSATATKLATARTIAGVSFDGSANISLNNNAITNGAGYITGLSFNNLSGKTSGTGDYSTDGDIVAGRGSGSIALTINDGKGNSNVTFNHQNGVPDQNGNAARIEVNTDSTSGATMYFELKSNVTGGSNTTLTNILDLTETAINPRKNVIPISDSSINLGSSSVRFLNGYFDNLYGSGANITAINASNISSGTIAAARVATLNQNTTGSSGSCTGNAATATTLQTARNIAGSSFNGGSNIDISYNNLTNKPTIPTNNNQLTNGAGYITSASAGIPASGGTFTGDISVSGGAGALNVNANSDIRLSSGNWTGNATKIQHHSNILYVQGGSSGIYFRAQNGTNRWAVNSSGHLLTPDHNGSYDIGSSSRRVRNIYVNDMHFANSTENPNKVDGTWGDWTLQEGEDQIYMLNNRNGKKYKMNLTEIV